jgi:methylmalonyl-CoA/ethylmalonyl-CoA epimerase
MVSDPMPAVAFGGRRIAWLYTPTRQLLELVETDDPRS